jgi:type II secretory pathway pseudopilin PulG
MTSLEWALLMAAYAGLEYWLGRTKKVESNSALDFVLQTARSALSGLARRKK